ncbi:TPA: hypothetical protein ACFP4U_001953 [Neisseria lactamica]
MTDLFLNAGIVEDKNGQSPFSNIFDFFASLFISPARLAMAAALWPPICLSSVTLVRKSSNLKLRKPLAGRV